MKMAMVLVKTDYSVIMYLPLDFLTQRLAQNGLCFAF